MYKSTSGRFRLNCTRKPANEADRSKHLAAELCNFVLTFHGKAL
jgi:hypothetical protein